MKRFRTTVTHRTSRKLSYGWMLAALCTLPVAAAHGASPMPPPTAPAPSAPSSTSDGALCVAAITGAERAARLPVGLMRAISLVESGRPDPVTGRATPWPWTINVAGAGYFFATKAEAIAAVEAARAKGVTSIDVGCMQVNLLHHPNAFASLDLAFNPDTNAAYAADLLTRLFGMTGHWFRATAAYHSSTPGIGDAYATRVGAIWPIPGGNLPIRAVPAGVGGRTTAVAAGGRPGLAPVDPYDVYTPEFRARLQRDAADRALRQAALGRGGLLTARANPSGPYTRLASAGGGAADASRPW